MDARIETALRSVRSAWRHKWLALGAAAAAAILGICAVMALPSRYEATARLFIDTSSILGPALEGLAVQQNTMTKVEAVRRALVSRPKLEGVIDATALRTRVHTERERAELVIDLADSIKLQAATAANQREPSFFTISYRDTSPQVAHDVVAHLVEEFFKGSQAAGESDAASTEEFLTRQIDEFSSRLNEAEAKLADFKRRNIGAMPDDRGDSFQRVQAVMAALDQARSDLAVATSQRNELRSKLIGDSGDNGGRASANDERFVSSYDTRMTESRLRLEQLLVRFTDAHPDVISEKETLSNLEKMRQAELAALRSNGSNLGSPRTNSTSLVLQNLQVSLNEVEVRIATLRSQIANNERRLTELRASVNTMPEIEAELAGLTRDYGTTKSQYESLLKRLESVRLSGQASERQRQQFRVVDPPTVPLVPVFPRRALFLAVVMLASLGFGGALAYGMTLVRPVIADERDLAARFPQLRVGGSLYQIDSPATIKTRTLRNRLFTVASTALVVLFGATIATQSLIVQLLQRTFPGLYQ